MRLGLRAALAVVAVSACMKTNDVTVRTSPIDDRSPEDTGDDYDFQHVSAEGYTQQRPGFFAVHTDSDWRDIWNEDAKGNRPAVPPTFDLKGHMLFVATSKTPGATSIEVQKITHTFDGLHIYVLETLPSPACPPEPVKAPPMDIVSLENVTLDIHVTYDRMHAESCGPPPDAIIACRIAGSGSPGSDKITASPGEVVDCDCNQSRPRTGIIKQRSWQLHEPPPGSLSKFTVGKGDIGGTFPVDAWGSYEVDLDIKDATRAASTSAFIDVLPPGDAGVELYFTNITSPDPAALPHVKLHVVQLPQALGSGGDCSALSQKSWCEMHTTPTLQQAILRPEEKKRYRVVVEYLDPRLPGTAVPCVRLFAKGAKAESTCEALDAQRAKNATWELGALDMPHATFYDARLPKPPETASAAPPPPPAATQTVKLPPSPPPPPPPIPSSTSSASIEL